MHVIADFREHCLDSVCGFRIFFAVVESRSMTSMYLLLLSLAISGYECFSKHDVFHKQPAFANQMCPHELVAFQTVTRSAVSCAWACDRTSVCRSFVYLHGNKTCFGIKSDNPFSVATPLYGAAFYRSDSAQLTTSFSTSSTTSSTTESVSESSTLSTAVETTASTSIDSSTNHLTELTTDSTTIGQSTTVGTSVDATSEVTTGIATVNVADSTTESTTGIPTETITSSTEYSSESSTASSTASTTESTSISTPELTTESSSESVTVSTTGSTTETSTETSTGSTTLSATGNTVTSGDVNVSSTSNTTTVENTTSSTTRGVTGSTTSVTTFSPTDCAFMTMWSTTEHPNGTADSNTTANSTTSLPSTALPSTTLTTPASLLESDCNPGVPMLPGVPDAKMSASSVCCICYEAWNGRLNSPRAWSGDSYEPNVTYIQIDFESQRNMTSILTQGEAFYEEWVTSYNLHVSDDCVVFTAIKDDKGNATVFTGNTDRNTIVTHHLVPPVTGRCLRLLPIEWQSLPSVRMEVIGCLA